MAESESAVFSSKMNITRLLFGYVVEFVSACFVVLCFLCGKFFLPFDECLEIPTIFTRQLHQLVVLSLVLPRSLILDFP